MNKKNLMILGIEIGVILFFIGVALNIALGPTTDNNKMPQQVSSFVKLVGMGITTLSIFIGGIFIEKMELVTRILLVVFGVILLSLNIAIISLVPYY
jgi:hypothetical protein